MSLAHHPWQLALLFSGGAALGVSLAGPLAATTVIAKWFDEKRGLAVGIAAMGPPTGGLLLTPLAGWLLTEFGWRETLQVFGMICLLLAPLAWLVVKNTPGEVGQTVDGLAPTDPIAKVQARPEALNLGEIIRSRNFWSLALAMGIVFGIGGGWNANAPRFGEDLGYSGQHMSSLIGIAAGLGIPSTLLFGLLADRFDNRRLLWWAIGGQALSFLLLLEPVSRNHFHRSDPALWFFRRRTSSCLCFLYWPPIRSGRLWWRNGSRRCGGSTLWCQCSHTCRRHSRPKR